MLLTKSEMCKIIKKVSKINFKIQYIYKIISSQYVLKYFSMSFEVNSQFMGITCLNIPFWFLVSSWTLLLEISHVYSTHTKVVYVCVLLLVE